MGLFVLCLVLFGVLQVSGYSWKYDKHDYWDRSKRHDSHERSWEPSWRRSRKHDPWDDWSSWRGSDKHDPWDRKHDPWDRKHDPWSSIKHDPWDSKKHDPWDSKKHDPWDRKKHDPWNRKKHHSRRSKGRSLLKTGKAILSLLPKVLDLLKGKRHH